MALTTAIRTNLHLVVRLGLVWACGTVTPSTAHTSLSDNVMGIYSPIDGSTSMVTCYSGANFRTWSTWARCCASDSPSCEFVTRCDGGTAYGFNGNTDHCNQDYPNCVTITIYDRYTAHSASWIHIDCGSRWSAYTIYRELEDSTTSTSTTPTTTPSASTSEPSLTSVVTTPTASPPIRSSTAATDPKPSTSNAWIAGPVAGGIVALLLLGALSFWWRRRKSAQESNNTPSMAQTGAAGGYFPKHVGNPHENNHTQQSHGPSSPPAALYHPSNSPPNYTSHSPEPHGGSNPLQYKYPASRTPNTMPWQGSPMPVSELDSTGMAVSELDATGMAASELDSTGMQHQHTIAEAS